MARLVFLGTSDAFNGAGRGNSCYWVEDAGGCFAVDFGPTALRQCQVLGLPLERLDGVFLTHLHGDHIGGLAVLLIDLRFRRRRERPFVIAGPPGTRARVDLLRASAFPSLMADNPFVIEWPEWAVGGTVEVLGRAVTAIQAVHDRHAIATSFRVTCAAGESLAFSGDTGWQPALAELVRGADAFVCECSGVNPDFGGHLSVAELRAVRAELEVGTLYLSHLSAESRVVATEAQASLVAVVADDGLAVQVPAGGAA